MGTRAIIQFKYADREPMARIYKHWDGYPEGTLPILRSFFDEVTRQTSDRCFMDPSYLAAKFVVFLSRIYATTSKWPSLSRGGEYRVDLNDPLDFLSVGIVSGGGVGEEYVYTVLAEMEGGYPKVSYRHVNEDVETEVNVAEVSPDEETDRIWAAVRKGIPAGTSV